MLSLGRARAKVVGMLSGSSGYATAPTSTITSIINFWQQEQSFETRRLIRRYLIITLIVIWTVKLWFAPMALALASAQPFMMSQTTNIQQAYPEFSALDYHTTTQLPYIPPKIWQIYLDFSEEEVSKSMNSIEKWILKSPSYQYTVLDKEGAHTLVEKLSKSNPRYADALSVYFAMSRRVLRADFMRYLLLALEGGVYSDMDTEPVTSVDNWVPDEYKNKTRLIVGIEADAVPPVAGTSYEVQFCQWTLAGAAGHPALWTMVEGILEDVRSRPHNGVNVDFSNDDVLGITGPAGWTEVVYMELTRQMGTPITWRNLTGLRKPKLYGDILVLPINGFASNVPHSNADPNGEGRAVVHGFHGSWRGGD